MTDVTRRAAFAATGVGLLAAAGCGSSFKSATATAPQKTTGTQKLTVLFGSSGTAETANLQSLCNAWATKNSAKVNVLAASNLPQQLSQGFAANKPADIFYVDPTLFQSYVKAGNLYAYGDKLSADGFYPNLTSLYTSGGKLYCVPKDFSTLGLQINTKLWSAAGLTAADYPTTWAQLTAVSKKLTSAKVVGLSMSTSRDRVGAFMRQAGGWYLNSDQTKATADSAANMAALTYLKSLLSAGTMKWASDIGATWGGEAFGTGKAAMTIEGNWIASTMTSDYPGISYANVALPKGPAGSGTLSFVNGWGVAAKSAYQSAAVSLVEYLCSTSSQLSIAKGIGTMPSRQALAADYVKAFPAQKAFADEASYAHGQVTLSSMTAVLADFDTQLASLATQAPATILTRLQKNTAAAIGS
jgi:multiple sugar transport system substrate-binding protein